nr:reverse transcriptase domain, reverse transcriptase zinc-binding domain protein [Tanacetum cinerariifolium]
MKGVNVAKAFVNHYTNFLGVASTYDILVTWELFCDILSHNKAENMIRGVTSNDINDVIFPMRYDKSRGLDGFTYAFFKNSWDIIELTRQAKQDDNRSKGNPES